MARTEMLPARQVLANHVHHNRYAIGVLGLLSLVAYGSLAFNLTLAGDDWYLVRNPSLELDTYIPVGRWMRPVVLWLFFDGRFAPAFTLVGWVLLMTSAAVLLSFVVKAHQPVDFFLFSALFLFCPVLAELANFKNSHLMIGFGAICAAASVYLLHRVVEQEPRLRPRSYAAAGLAGLFLLLSLGIQQSFLLFVFMFFIASAIEILTSGRDAATSKALRAMGIYVATGLVIVLVYFVVTKSLQAYFDFPLFQREYALETSLVRTPEELADSARLLLAHVTTFFFEGQHLWPGRAKAFFIVVLLVYLYGLLRKVFDSGDPRDRRAVHAVGVAILVAGLVVTPWLLGLIRVPYSYRYNGLLGLVPFYPIVVAQALRMVTSRPVRSCVVAAAVALVLTFVYFQNVASLAVYTTNTRDRFLADRILTRIENHDGYRKLAGAETVHVVLVGRLPLVRDLPFNDFLPGNQMGDSIVNCGVFNCQTNRIPELMAFVEYSSDRRRYSAWSPQLLSAMSETERTEVVAAIARARAWPDPEAVQIVGSTVYVVLGDPQGGSRPAAE